MKFINTETGVISETENSFVIEQLKKNKSFKEVQETVKEKKEKPQK